MTTMNKTQNQPEPQPEPVSNEHLGQALHMLGKVLHADGLQAFVLSDNAMSRVDELFDLTNVNRDINMDWVSDMKKEIVESHARGTRMTVTVGIDVRDIRSLLEVAVVHPDQEAEACPQRDRFRVKVYDGQHRLTALSQLHREEPNKVYEFYVMVYIIESNHDERLLLEKINRRLEFTQKDRKVVDSRKAFLDVWEECTTPEHQHRLCVKNVRASKKIRDPAITKALSNMTPALMKDKLYQIAERYHAEFLTRCENKRFARSKVHEVISDTKLYQLICYYDTKDDSWLDQLAA